MAKTNGNGLTELEKAFEEDMNLGFEEVSATNLQIPFLRIIQALSPQVKKTDGEYIEGASQGDIFNTVTRKRWGDEGVVVIPTYFQMKFLEFVPRTQGGGFIGELSAASEDVRTAVRDKDTGMELLENGNELVRTAQHYVKLVHEDGSLESYRLKSVEDGNDKGSWYSWNVSIEGDIDGLQTYLECKDFHKSVSSGELQLAPPPPEAIGVSAEDLPF